MPRPPIQVFEFEKLTLKPDEQGRYLTKPELDKLYEYNDRNKNVYFTGIRDGIKFSSYVGVIQIGGLTLEILPKADKNKTNDKKEYNKWQLVLLRMLSICNHIKINSVSEASLEKRPHSLLDLYFKLYLDEVSNLVRQGLIKKYHKKAGNLFALKGRLVFSKNIQQNLIHQERFYTEHQVYDFEHLHNQILIRGLTVLSKVSTNPAIIDSINRIKLDFPEMKEIQITQNHFDFLKDNRKTESYKNAIKIAKMIILNYSPDIKSGGENMLALLFDMNKLWEEYIYRMIKRTADTNIHVNFQNSQKFWESKTIRPDLVITKKIGDNSETFVIDTKWKVLDYKSPSDDDLKQMYAYNLYWNASKSMLLYPKTKEFDENFGHFHKGRDGDNKCKLGFINVLDGDGKLDLGIGNEILLKLEI
jgi:5-methylcytosine-specific restriction enzyme subunit McrC